MEFSYTPGDLEDSEQKSERRIKIVMQMGLSSLEDEK